jgi:hypothetical protein
MLCRGGGRGGGKDCTYFVQCVGAVPYLPTDPIFPYSKSPSFKKWSSLVVAYQTVVLQSRLRCHSIWLTLSGWSDT